MKTIKAALVLSAVMLGGCVAVPVGPGYYGGPGYNTPAPYYGYYGPPVYYGPSLGIGIYGGRGGYRGGYRGWR